MTRYVLALLGLLLAVPAMGYDDLVLPRVEFDAVSVQQAGRFQSKEKIYYTPGKLRIERGEGFATIILDMTTQTQIMLMANHTYLVLPMDDEYFRRFIARTVSAGEAHKLGVEHVDGVKATKYSFGDDGALDAAGTYWLTDDGIMVRREYDAGVFGTDVHHREFLTDLKVEPQPGKLFAIPSNYKRAN
mgnify:CR=1 FL=1